MEKQLSELDAVLKALADPTRVRLLTLLLAGEVCVCHLYESLKLPQSMTSRHLAYLRRAGLVSTSKRGLWVYYTLAEHENPAIQAVIAAVLQSAAGLPGARKDFARLEAKTGCCVPAGVMASPATTARTEKR